MLAPWQPSRTPRAAAGSSVAGGTCATRSGSAPGWSRERFRGGWDWLEGLDVAAEVPVLGVLAVIAALVVLTVVFLPIVILLVDVLVLVVVVLGTLVARVVFRKPWTIEAKGFDGTVHRWEVVGWRASGDNARLVRSSSATGWPSRPRP